MAQDSVSVEVLLQQFVVREEVYQQDLQLLVSQVKPAVLALLPDQEREFFLPSLSEIESLGADFLADLKNRRQLQVHELTLLLTTNLFLLQSHRKKFMAYSSSSNRRIAALMREGKLTVSGEGRQPYTSEELIRKASQPSNHVGDYKSQLRRMLGAGLTEMGQKQIGEALRAVEQACTLKEVVLTIGEYFDTEENYLRDLELIENCLKPTFLRYMGKGKAEFLLGIEAIHQLTQLMHAEMLSKGGREISTLQFAKVFLKFIPGFCIYSEFLKAYNYSSDEIKAVLKKHPDLQFEQDGQSRTIDEGTIYAKIGTPFKRGLSYKAFIEKLIKKSAPDSEEARRLLEAEQGLSKVSLKNDHMVQQIENDTLVFQLNQKYGDILVPGVKRKYVKLYQNVRRLAKERPHQVILHCFNNLLLAEEDGRVLRVELGPSTYVTDIPNSKNFKNLFSVAGESGTMILMTDEPFLKAEILGKLREIIGDSEAIQVNVLGSEQMNSSSFSKYTVYIIEVKYGLARQLIFKRFSDIKRLCEKMGEGAAEFKGHVLTSMKSKTIDGRKLVIAEALSKILRNVELRQVALDQLGVDPSFLKPKQVDPRQIHRDQHTLASVLASCFAALGRFSTIDEEQVHGLTEGEEYHDMPVFIPNEILVKVTRRTMAREVAQDIRAREGMQCALDYKLCLETGRQNRIVDDDQRIWPYFEQVRPYRKNIIQRTVSSIKDFYFRIEKPRLYFKKVLFLPPAIEEAELYRDPIRLRMVAFQLFSEVKQLKYYLTFDSYCLLIALRCLYFAQGPDPYVSQGDVEATLPLLISETHSMAEWREMAGKVLAKLSTKGVVRDHRDLELILYNRLKRHDTFGAQLYYVQVHESMAKYLQEGERKFAFNMWLSIKSQGMQLLMPANKEIAATLEYRQVRNINPLCSSIELVVEGQSLRLNTDQAFQIAYLANIYIQINQQLGL